MSLILELLMLKTDLKISLKGVHGIPTNPTVKCTSCGKDYHTAAKCWPPGGGKEGKGPWYSRKKSEEKANPATNPYSDFLSVAATALELLVFEDEAT